MRDECEICQGRRTVRLPIYRPLRVSADISDDFGLPAYREFSCPQCTETVTIGQVQAVAETSEVPRNVGDLARLRETVHAGLARKLADTLLRDGAIKFEESGAYLKAGREVCAIRGTVGVVPPGRLDDLHKRIVEHQNKVAIAVVDEAHREIANWGSYYNHQTINKADAYRAIDSALSSVLKAKKEGRIDGIPVD